MSTEDKLHLTPFPPEDEKEAQKELNHLRKHIRNDGVFKTTHKWTGFQEKTLWDWLQLLLIPLVLTVGGLLFSTYQHNTDQQSALDQQQATILQTYFDNIQDLLLNHNLLKSSLDTSNPYHDVSILARARTLTAIQGLDPERKGLLVQFLYEAGLIGYSDTKNKPHLSIINLIGADLTDATLTDANLSGALQLHFVGDRWP
jgi:Pentapeptide repeats (8 copies)